MTPAPFVFGDSDPEDAWQIDDPLPVLIDNLERRVIRLADLDRVRVVLLVRHFQIVLDRIRAENG